MKIIACMILLFLWGSTAWCVPRAFIVYRADSRNISEIIDAGGMWPRYDSGARDDILVHHFEGESVEGGTSNFVSTSRTIQGAVEHGAFRLDEDDPDSTTYIYSIRPNNQFYDVEASIINARNSTNIQQNRERLQAILTNYGNMEEIVARGGFNGGRIVNYAALTTQMVRTHGIHAGSVLFSDSFWASRWIMNQYYDPQNNSDASNDQVYPNVGQPGGSILEATNDTSISLRLGFTCLGVSQNNAASSRIGSDEVCPAGVFFRINKVGYHKRWLHRVTVLTQIISATLGDE